MRPRLRVRRFGSALLVPMLALVSSLARADSPALDEAIAAFEHGDSQRARAALERALADGHATRSELADAYRYLAAIQFAQGDRDGAGNCARAAVALAPRSAPPSDSPRALTELFDRARAIHAGQPVRVVLDFASPLVGGQSDTLRITPSGVPPVLPVRVSARCASEGNVIGSADTIDGAGPYELSLRPIEAFAPIDCVVSLSTPSGVVLDRRTLHAAALARDPRMAPDASPASRGAHPPSPWAIAGISGAFVGLAIAVIVGIVLTGENGNAHLGTPVAQP